MTENETKKIHDRMDKLIVAANDYKSKLPKGTGPFDGGECLIAFSLCEQSKLQIRVVKSIALEIKSINDKDKLRQYILQLLIDNKRHAYLGTTNATLTAKAVYLVANALLSVVDLGVNVTIKHEILKATLSGTMK